MRRLRWIVYAPVALIAIFSSPAVAQDFQTWTCWQSNELSWQMQQPITDYQAGLYPTWSDCEAWRDGTPADGWQWSYGASVTTTTSSSSTVEVTSTVEQTTTSTLPATTTTSTTEPATTTTETTTTTSQPAPTPAPIPETTSTQPIPETTVAPSTTATPTTLPPTTSTSSAPPRTTLPATIPVLPTSSTPVAPESTQAPTTPLSTFVSPETSLGLASEQVPTLGTQPEAPLPGASEQEKEAFEEQVNIFDGTHDEYVPAGSTITVAQRRTIVAASTILVTLPTPVATRRRT